MSRFIQNALLRMFGNLRYPNSPGGPAVVMSLLKGLLAHPVHVFWPDALSWDSYLLALAVHH